jgi:hypothetical protein
VFRVEKESVCFDVAPDNFSVYYWQGSHLHACTLYNTYMSEESEEKNDYIESCFFDKPPLLQMQGRQIVYEVETV